jgi:hypothetical protein
MATPADQRLLELLDRWLTSLELHLKYSSLDDDSYWKIQPWVEHQRPNRWIIDLARQKTAALKANVEERVKVGDAKFSDALEHMMFLANLVGLQHIERFIPVAEPDREQALPTAAAAASELTVTREMPKFLVDKPHVPPATASAQVARTERKRTAQPKPATKTAAKQAAKPLSDAAHDQVIADAERLLQWGRKWFELPELIARMADRPPMPEVRRILNENRTLLEKSGRDRQA